MQRSVQGCSHLRGLPERGEEGGRDDEGREGGGEVMRGERREGEGKGEGREREGEEMRGERRERERR